MVSAIFEGFSISVWPYLTALFHLDTTSEAPVLPGFPQNSEPVLSPSVSGETSGKSHQIEGQVRSLLSASINNKIYRSAMKVASAAENKVVECCLLLLSSLRLM